jgi:hypothetical protein
MARQDPPLPTTPQRKRTYRLTDETEAGLAALATRHNTTKTTLIEALGCLGEHGDPTFAQIIRFAQRLDRERNSRW